MREGRLPAARRKGLDVVVWVDGDPLQDIDQIGVGIDAVQAASGHQTLDDANVLGTDFGPTEQPRLPVMRSFA